MMTARSDTKHDKIGKNPFHGGGWGRHYLSQGVGSLVLIKQQITGHNNTPSPE